MAILASASAMTVENANPTTTSRAPTPSVAFDAPLWQHGARRQGEARLDQGGIDGNGEVVGFSPADHRGGCQISSGRRQRTRSAHPPELRRSPKSSGRAHSRRERDEGSTQERGKDVEQGPIITDRTSDDQAGDRSDDTADHHAPRPWIASAEQLVNASARDDATDQYSGETENHFSNPAGVMSLLATSSSQRYPITYSGAVFIESSRVARSSVIVASIADHSSVPQYS